MSERRFTLPQQRNSTPEAELFFVVVGAFDGVNVNVLLAQVAIESPIPLAVEVMCFVYHFAPAVKDSESVVAVHDIVQRWLKYSILH